MSFPSMRPWFAVVLAGDHTEEPLHSPLFSFRPKAARVAGVEDGPPERR